MNEPPQRDCWLTSQPPPDDCFVNIDARKAFEAELAERWLRRQEAQDESSTAEGLAMASFAISSLIAVALLLDLIFHAWGTP